MRSSIEWYYELTCFQLLHRIAPEFGLDPLLVAAMIHHESGGVGLKTRYEPHTSRYVLFPREHASHLGITVLTESTAQMHSYGLMQIMGFVARELGYKGYLIRLCEEELGLRYGCMKLKTCFQKYGDEAKAVSAYNQGSPRTTAGGMFENQKSYVDPVFALYRELVRAKESDT